MTPRAHGRARSTKRPNTVSNTGTQAPAERDPRRTGRRLLWHAALCLIAAGAQAQGDPWSVYTSDPNYGSHRFLQATYHTGGHLYSGENLATVLEQGYRGLELRYGWQAQGNRSWQRVYNLPLYGIGVYSGHVGDASVLGRPHAVYGFFHHPLWRTPRHHFNWEVALGLTYDLEPYDPETNPDNDAIGSRIAVYFNAQVGGNYSLSRALDLTYGIDLTHFSNGRTNLPNYGLNLMGLNAGLRYHYNAVQPFAARIKPGTRAPRRPTAPALAPDPPDLTRDLVLYAALGSVENEQGDGQGTHYLSGSLYLEYARRFAEQGGWTAGVDWFYDGSLGPQLRAEGDSNVTSFDLMYGGLHGGLSLFIDRIQIEGHLGTYWYIPQQHNGAFWMRIAGRYNLSDRLFAQVGLKSRDGAAADWIEWGVGYRLVRQR